MTRVPRLGVMPMRPREVVPVPRYCEMVMDATECQQQGAAFEEEDSYCWYVLRFELAIGCVGRHHLIR